MKILKHLLTLIACFICVGTYAQSTWSISGSVTDSKGEAISYGAAVVYSGDRIVGGDVTDDKGRFRVDVKKTKENLTLSVEFIGYCKKTIEIGVMENSVNLGGIVLEEDSQQLGEAVVSASTESHKATLEKTSINASSQMTSSKGSAIDVLSSAASVTIAGDMISIRGNSNILVLMDGIPTTVSDLSSIPAANIKNIDIITNPDASHDAGGTGGIINIISKKGTAHGFSGIVAANYGFNHFVTGNVSMAYNKKKAQQKDNADRSLIKLGL